MSLYSHLSLYLWSLIDNYHFRIMMKNKMSIVVAEFLSKYKAVEIQDQFFALFVVKPDFLVELPGYNFRKLVNGGYSRAIWTVVRDRWIATDAMLPTNYLFSSGKNREDGFDYF